MDIYSRKSIIDKLVVRKDNILLDYICFHKKYIVDISFIGKKWLEYIQTTDVPVKFYLHIPFCSKICKYCMYNTILIDNKEEIEEYILELKKFILYFTDIFSNTIFQGIYIGGGTPSVLSPQQFQDLFGEIFNQFKFDPDFFKTIELNPSSTNFEKLDTLRSLGFDRVSFGVQSFHKPTLEKENRTYVSPERVKELVLYAKNIGFLDVNTDIIVGMNDESEVEILKNLEYLKDIEPYTITVYTILKDMERSVFYREDKDSFYRQIRHLYGRVIKKSQIDKTYHIDSWSNVLGFNLNFKSKPESKKLYDAHTEDKQSLFGVGYKSYSKIWGVGSYEMTNFSKDNFLHNFSPLSEELEIYSYVLQAFQFRLDKNDFKRVFGKDFDSIFQETILYLEQEKIIENTVEYIQYIGDEKQIGYYGMLFLDGKNLLRFIKYRFYEKK